ncbi:MAG TPA: PIG-L family deacetylase [Verrucomicrobiae bacterium]|nr:PIG-L family deacetylase [Verrucomicrobiae bacterium]
MRTPSRLASAARLGGVSLMAVLLAVEASLGASANGARPGTGSLLIPPGARVLVFAPHPDDETIGAGGLTFRLARRGVPVRVVFVTNGDGYAEAVERDFHEQRPRDTDYVEFGEIRRREAVAAARHLGLHRGDLVFLGFPDGGLAQLWQDHWSRTRPYTSPYTKEDSPSVPDGAEYDGQDLASLVSRELRTFRPTVVVIPHPYDAHLDHAHASYFVIDALDALQTAHVLPERILVLTYLVHHPTWPSAGSDRDRLAPPSVRETPDTLWTGIDLTPAELAAKEAALGEYRTQLPVLGDLLRRFCRPNELYGRVKSRVLDAIAEVH